MSSIPTKHISGDVAVGRNVSAGGNANVQGNVRVGHNLKVEGWLEVRNIKGADKGLYASVEILEATHPDPEDGWWAMVGTTVPAPLYIAKDGQWIATEGMGGPVLEGVDVTPIIEDIEKLKEDIGDSATLVHLDENGLISESYLPDISKSVVFFHGFTTEDLSAPLLGLSPGSSSDSSSRTPGCEILFDVDLNRFIMRDNQGSIPQYYSNWVDRDRFGELTDGKCVPVSNRLYVCVGSREIYYWDEDEQQLLTVGCESSANGQQCEFLKCMTPPEIISPFDEEYTILTRSADDSAEGDIVYRTDKKRFFFQTEEGCYSNWRSARSYGSVGGLSAPGVKPFPGKIYFRTEDKAFVSFDDDGELKEMYKSSDILSLTDSEIRAIAASVVEDSNN